MRDDAASILTGRHLAAKLVEEIEDESDLVDRRGLGGSGSFHDGKAPAIGMHIEVEVTSHFGEPPLRPQPRFVGGERLPAGRVDSNDYGDIQGAIEEAVTVLLP